MARIKRPTRAITPTEEYRWGQIAVRMSEATKTLSQVKARLAEDKLYQAESYAYVLENHIKVAREHIALLIKGDTTWDPTHIDETVTPESTADTFRKMSEQIMEREG